MNAIDPYEQVLEVKVMISAAGTPASKLDKDSKVATNAVMRYVVADTHPVCRRVAHYRTDAPLSVPDAWTASVNGSRWHKTRAAAQNALYYLRAERMMQDIDADEPIDPEDHPDKRSKDATNSANTPDS